MKAEEVQQIICSALDEMKGENPVSLDVRRLTDIADVMMVASGNSSRHVISIADKILERTRERGLRPAGMEGMDLGEWALLDFGDVVVHVMQPKIRDFYQLEKLWADIEEKSLAMKAKLKKA